MSTCDCLSTSGSHLFDSGKSRSNRPSRTLEISCNYHSIKRGPSDIMFSSEHLPLNRAFSGSLGRPTWNNARSFRLVRLEELPLGRTCKDPKCSYGCVCALCVCVCVCVLVCVYVCMCVWNKCSFVWVGIRQYLVTYLVPHVLHAHMCILKCRCMYSDVHTNWFFVCAHVYSYMHTHIARICVFIYRCMYKYIVFWRARRLNTCIIIFTRTLHAHVFLYVYEHGHTRWANNKAACS